MVERHPLALAAAEHPNALAVTDTSVRLRWGELWEAVQYHAAFLRTLALPPGEAIALQPAPSLQSLIWVHALWLADIPVMLVPPSATTAEMNRLVEHYPIAGLLGEAAPPDVDGTYFPWQFRGTMAPDRRDTVCMDLPRFYVFTSGTTGTPKAVPLTGAQLAQHAEAARMHLDLQPSDCWLACLPFHHIGGLSVILRAAFLRCGLHLEARFSAERINAALDQGSISHASLVPTMLFRLLAERGQRAFPPSVRCLLIGGAPASPDLLERARGLNAPLALTYGLTEACSQVTTLRPEAFLRGEHSAGHPLPCTEVTIRAETDAQLQIGDCPPSAEGEIWVRGETVLRAYYGQGDCRTEDGWFRTGDWGRWGPDGALVVLDRRTDLILSGGENIYPSDIEAVLRKHPAVLDAAVIGVPHPEWGQAVVAFVESKDKALARGLTEHCRRFLAGYKIPKKIVIVDALPRTAAGKVRRSVLREQTSDQWPPASIQEDGLRG